MLSLLYDAGCPPSPRDRILHAALTLLERGGVDAVSTRAISAAAAVQAPTIYRQFGDMQGLLNAVASTGFDTYLALKTAQPPRHDPVEDLRHGWNLHVEFGLTHPHLYTLMYGAPHHSAASPAATRAAAMLHALLQRVAETGRLTVSVDRAAAIIHAACMGITLHLLRTPEHDPQLATLMRDAVLDALLTPGASAAPSAARSARQQATTHAIALLALLPDLPEAFSRAEQALLAEWLRRLT
ncbi:TetR/AcrR family transcriptional regulator [Deinococcus maricopensis]|uniref:Regulatory protein TetR n=1 Tax=Deinococcus maricopensis (strain DSM 21211 / LMG 22137 / NRRL B-23946 / LB-34) TaxID=709986 RepID=E8U307_DEIML|nr:regulatory protein TetR [Deinococcus maricopensis DSM 21211]